MAGQAARGTRGHGRPSRRASSSALGGPVSGVGSAPAATAPTAASTPRRAATRPVPATRRTHRTLTALGLTPDEAANLTAYLCGLPVDSTSWSLRQINALLFFRELRRTGRFGRLDGRLDRLH